MPVPENLARTLVEQQTRQTVYMTELRQLDGSSW
jgi:hypothetical protein